MGKNFRANLGQEGCLLGIGLTEHFLKLMNLKSVLQYVKSSAPLELHLS